MSAGEHYLGDGVDNILQQVLVPRLSDQLR
jgi:hypothetical protein